MNPLWIILGIVAVLIFIVIGIYNGLVSKRQRCNQAFADIDVQLKQRQKSHSEFGGNSEGLCKPRARNVSASH